MEEFLQWVMLQTYYVHYPVINPYSSRVIESVYGFCIQIRNRGREIREGEGRWRDNN